MDWWDRPVAALDTETTGLDKYGGDCIVQLALVAVSPNGKRVGEPMIRLCQPTTVMHPSAQAVHGISHERAMDEGVPMPGVLEELTDKLDQAFDGGFPVAMFNALFDWPMILTEYKRHGMEDKVPAIYCLDVYLLAAAAMRHSSSLAKLVAKHGVGLQAGSHDAGHDALLTGALLFALLDRYGWLRKPLEGYYDEQLKWSKKYPHRGSTPDEIWPTGMWTGEYYTDQLCLAEDWGKWQHDKNPKIDGSGGDTTDRK